MLTLDYPFILLLIALPWLIQRFVPPAPIHRASLHIPFMSRLEDASGRRADSNGIVRKQNLFQTALRWIIWSLVLVAIARPQWFGEPLSKTVASRELLLAVDISASMDQKDFIGPSGEEIDRLAAVKIVVDEFLSRRESDRVGLLLFGSGAFIQVPFTEDIETCRALLNEAEIGMAGPQTVIGDAIGLGITVFEKSRLEDRTLILLTDGNDSGSKIPPSNAAKIAADYGITIHTIAFGNIETTGQNKIDEEALKIISAATGGQFFKASSREELVSIYQTIDDLKAADAEVVSYRPVFELFHWPLGLSFIFAFAGHAILAWRSRK